MVQTRTETIPNPHITVDNFREVVEDLMHGAIDMHVHFHPDVPPFPSRLIARRLDAVQTAQQAKDAGMRAIVLKSHTYPTAAVAEIAAKQVPGIDLFGTIVLNHSVGGLNPLAVEIAAKMSKGRAVLFMPTWNSAYQLSKGAQGAPGSDQQGITLLDEKGKLKPVMHDILDIVKQYDMVITTGHTGLEEHLALVEEARSKGIRKVVVSHVRQEFPVEARIRMADLGAIIEHSYLQTLSYKSRGDPTWIMESVKAIGAQRCSIVVDIGHVANPAPADAYRVFIATLIDLGLSEEEVRYLAQINPARLLDLD